MIVYDVTPNYDNLRYTSAGVNTCTERKTTILNIGETKTDSVQLTKQGITNQQIQSNVTHPLSNPQADSNEKDNNTNNAKEPSEAAILTGNLDVHTK